MCRQLDVVRLGPVGDLFGLGDAAADTEVDAGGGTALHQLFGSAAAHVRVADDAVAHRPAQQLVDGDAVGLAGDVPQRNVHRREGAAGDLVVGEKEATGEALPVVFNPQRVGA